MTVLIICDNTSGAWTDVTKKELEEEGYKVTFASPGNAMSYLSKKWQLVIIEVADEKVAVKFIKELNGHHRTLCIVHKWEQTLRYPGVSVLKTMQKVHEPAIRLLNSSKGWNSETT